MTRRYTPPPTDDLTVFSSTDPASSDAVATAVVDNYGSVLITTTAAGNAQTIGNPTKTDEVKRLTVMNNDTSSDSIAVNGVTLAAGECEDYIWDGTAWLVIGVGGGGGAVEGTAVLSTGEVGGTKFLREDGDGTCSWQPAPGGGDVSKVGTPVDNQMAVWTGDGTLEGTADFTYDGTNLNLVTAKNFQIAGSTILADAAGTTTLSNIDAIDATTEATIEAAIDTLANLTSIQSHTVTLTGDFIRSGAHSLTLTTTGVTDVTLPTTGTLATTSNKLSDFAATTSAELAGVISDETGSGALVFGTSPTLTTPNIGVATGTTLSLTADSNQIILNSDEGSGYTMTITGTATGSAKTITLPDATGTVALTANKLSVFAATTSAELAGVISDETGSGALVFANTPTLITPNIGVATGTSLNLTANSNQIVLDSDDGSGFTTTITDSATAARVITLPDLTGTVALTANNLSVFAATTSAQLAGVISDETGSGSLVFGTAPTFTTSITVTGGGLIDADGIDLDTGNDYQINNVSVLNATTLGSAVVTSSLTTVGALNAGSITSGFGSIDNGSSSITTTGTITGGTFDTGVSAAGVTLTGTTLAADGTDAAIDIAITPKGNAGIVLPNAAGAPADTTSKLYQTGGVLYFDGVSLEGTGGATTALDNLASVAINTSLVSDTDITDDLGTAAIRWKDIYAQTIGTGDTATDTLTIRARDVDGASWKTFITATAGNTPTMTINKAVTVVDDNNQTVLSFSGEDGATANYIQISNSLTGIGAKIQSLGTDANIDITLTPKGTGSVNLQDSLLERAQMIDCSEKVNALGDLGGGTDDIDYTAGSVVTATVSTSAETFTFSNPPASGQAGSFTLILTNGGSQTVNWPASVDWAGGTAPTLTAAGVDVLEFITTDAGTTWYGFAAGLDMK